MRRPRKNDNDLNERFYSVRAGCGPFFVSVPDRAGRRFVRIAEGRRTFVRDTKKPAAMTIAYLRISTGKQHLENQRDELQRFARTHDMTIDRWVTEVVSGRKKGRDRKLGALLRRLGPGDTLIVTELSRLSRTLTEIMSIMEHCLRRKIQLYSTKEGYAFDESINSKVLCFAFGLVAEIERNMISLRTKEALAARRAEGTVLGRRRGSCVKQRMLGEHREAIMEMLRAGSPLNAICRRFGVSDKTFHRFRLSDREIAAAYAACRA